MNVTRNRDESRKHCEISGWPQRDSAEHEEYAGALTGSGITENNITNTDRPKVGMLEEILSPSNLNQAYKRVKKNNGAGGVDGMKVEDLLRYLKDKGEEIWQAIKDGKYRPQPVRRVEIPKENGKKRNLGIPTAVECHTAGNSPGSDANL